MGLLQFVSEEQKKKFNLFENLNFADQTSSLFLSGILSSSLVSLCAHPQRMQENLLAIWSADLHHMLFWISMEKKIFDSCLLAQLLIFFTEHILLHKNKNKRNQKHIKTWNKVNFMLCSVIYCSVA